jgi:hypothetical protein
MKAPEIFQRDIAIMAEVPAKSLRKKYTYR